MLHIENKVHSFTTQAAQVSQFNNKLNYVMYASGEQYSSIAAMTLNQTELY